MLEKYISCITLKVIFSIFGLLKYSTAEKFLCVDFSIIYFPKSSLHFYTKLLFENLRLEFIDLHFIAVMWLSLLCIEEACLLGSYCVRKKKKKM